MKEKSDKLNKLSITQILFGFREALQLLYPVLLKFDLLEDDTQPYDDFDQIVEVLWNVLVVGSLEWKYDLASKPSLPRYGYTGISEFEGYIKVQAPKLPHGGQFVEFIGDRSLGSTPFNAVCVETPDGMLQNIAVTADMQFEWVTTTEHRTA